MPKRSTNPEDVYFAKSKQDLLEGNPDKRKKNKLKIQSPTNKSGDNTDSSLSIKAKFSPVTPKHNLDEFDKYQSNEHDSYDISNTMDYSKVENESRKQLLIHSPKDSTQKLLEKEESIILNSDIEISN